MKEAQTKNSETKTDEKVKAKADNMAKQDDFVTFGLNLVSKINDLNTAVVGKLAKLREILSDHQNDLGEHIGHFGHTFNGHLGHITIILGPKLNC